MMAPRDDNWDTEWIYDDCCDISLTYEPPLELGNAWCAAAGGPEFYNSLKEDGTPRQPCSLADVDVEGCKLEDEDDEWWSCDDAIEHLDSRAEALASTGEDSAVWAVPIIDEMCCGTEPMVLKDECGCPHNPECDAASAMWEESCGDADLKNECPATCQATMDAIEAACNIGDAQPIACEHGGSYGVTCWGSGTFMKVRASKRARRGGGSH